MFGVGTSELLVIFGLALIIVGPSKLPDLAKGLAKGLGEFRKVTDEVKATITESSPFTEIKELEKSIKGTPINPTKPPSTLFLRNDLKTKTEASSTVTPVVMLNKFESSPSKSTIIPEAVIKDKNTEKHLANRIGLIDKIIEEHEQVSASIETADLVTQSSTPIAIQKDNN